MPSVTDDDLGASRRADEPLSAEESGLSLNPMRGVRYVPEKVTGLAEVTSPPYDVLDAAGVLALESSDPHNVVRLILPRDEDSGPEGRYEHAARALRAWLAEGVLHPDPSTGLYVYEQSEGATIIQRGLIGALGLRDPDQRVVLPHEDVMPGPVADRLELMRAARANVEPILLMYDGGAGLTSRVIDRVASGPALVTATADDGITHRLWQLSEADDLEAVQSDLRGRQALIADGHHRYAAYRLLQSEIRAEAGAGPWDDGLALLVDSRAHPPHVGAIHRTIDGLTVRVATRAAGTAFEARDLPREAVAGRLGSLRPGELLLVDAHRAAILTAREPAAVSRLVTSRHPKAWGDLDTAVLHSVLIDRLWNCSDESIRYHHDPAQALDYVQVNDALGVLLAPVTVEQVLAIAAEGVRMPRKSTSFGPKPRTGLVLRSFDLV
jgi:uncharacterized protein (DUF1015 family)